jgi:hypothetical protein
LYSFYRYGCKKEGGIVDIGFVSKGKMGKRTVAFQAKHSRADSADRESDPVEVISGIFTIEIMGTILLWTVFMFRTSGKQKHHRDQPWEQTFLFHFFIWHVNDLI